MNKKYRLIKTQQSCRPDYIQFPLLCPICKEIRKNSKKFKSPYSLLYHLTNSHTRDDEIISNLKLDDVRDVARSISKACQWEMF